MNFDINPICQAMMVPPQPPPRAMVETVDMLRRIWRFVRSAPLTYLWLIILAYTTTVAHDVNRQRLHHILVHRSTNLHHLDTNPIKVLIESLLWIDGRYWLPYLVVFTIFLAPAERWLGSLRWVLVDARTGRVVAGDRRTGYGLTLQQVAERLGYSDS
jgi:hypothetical protein